jgi:GTPase
MTTAKNELPKNVDGAADASTAQGDAGAQKAEDGRTDSQSLNAMLAKALAVRTSIASASESPPADLPIPPDPLTQRCGLIAIVGKPNVGKSTLLNALVGQKISITSRKAQTTRHRITGMRTVGETQFVFVDTPGFQTRHGNALNRSLNRTVVGAVNDVDLIVFVVEAGQFNTADAKVLALLPAKRRRFFWPTSST